MKKIILVGVTLFALGFVWLNHSKYKQAFDSIKWIEWVESENNANLRWQMIGSLTFNHKLKGLGKVEIKSLIGHPTVISTNTNTWSYNLGPTGSGINYGSLVIEFKDSKVADYRVAEH